MGFYLSLLSIQKDMLAFPFVGQVDLPPVRL